DGGMTIVASLAAMAYAWWASGLRPFSASATVAVLGAGVAAALLGRRRTSVTPVDRVTTAAVAPWCALFAALVTWQLVAYVQGPRSEHPTLSYLFSAAVDARPVRTLALVVWLAGAAWLGRR
ncbi:MAG: hypothetical protein M3Q82_02925, partial [Actinomycetota bacterium]|nr:hypothetical protein [Actinomycetota bacterium]